MLCNHQNSIKYAYRVVPKGYRWFQHAFCAWWKQQNTRSRACCLAGSPFHDRIHHSLPRRSGLSPHSATPQRVSGHKNNNIGMRSEQSRAASHGAKRAGSGHGCQCALTKFTLAAWVLHQHNGMNAKTLERHRRYLVIGHFLFPKPYVMVRHIAQIRTMPQFDDKFRCFYNPTVLQSVHMLYEAQARKAKPLRVLVEDKTIRSWKPYREERNTSTMEFPTLGLEKSIGGCRISGA